MSDQATPFLKSLKWRVECVVHSLVECLASWMPGSWVFHAGEWLAGVLWHVLPKRRRIVLRNLRIAFAGEMELPEIHALAKRCFRRSGANLISGAHTARLSADKLHQVLELENRDLLETALSKRRGVVLLLSHMGNWELLSRLIHFFPEDTPTGALYRPLNNVLMDRRVQLRREADGTRMFSKRDPFHRITGFLRGGGVVGVLVDQRVGINGDSVRFCGRLTKASPLPSLLARRTRSEVLALSLTTDRPGRWKAKFLPVEAPYSTDHCMQSLEETMKKHPEDVFWLQERWRVRLAPWYSLQDLLAADAKSEEGKAHRALLWLVGVADFAGLAPIWLNPDVVYEVALEEGAQLPSCLPKGTRIHRTDADSFDPCRAALRTIDDMEVLPLDFVLTVDEPDGLVRACENETIPVYLYHEDHVEFAGSGGKRHKVDGKWEMTGVR